MRKVSVALGLVLLALSLSACGGTPTPLTPEEALTKRAEAAQVEWNRGDWLEHHKYFSPRSREMCTNGEYAASAAATLLMIKWIFGIPEDAKLTINIGRVTVDGDVGRVYACGPLLRDGEPIEMGVANARNSDDSDEGEVGRWVYVDGEWWEEPDDMEETCHVRYKA